MVWFLAQSHDLGIMTFIFSAGNTGRGNMLLCTFQHQRLQSICVLWSNEWTPEATDVLPAFGTVTSLCWCQSCHLIATSCCRREDKWPAVLVTGCSRPRAHCLPTAKGKGKPSEEHTADRATVCVFLSAGCSGRMPQSDFYRLLLLSLCWSKLHVLNVSLYMPILSWIVFSHVFLFFFGGGLGGGER